MDNKQQRLVLFVLAGIALCALPLVAAQFGQSWVRIMSLSLLYVLLALALTMLCMHPVYAAISLAAALLPLFEEAPERWEALLTLNKVQGDATRTFGRYLGDWSRSAPEKHRDFIGAIAARLGATLLADIDGLRRGIAGTSGSDFGFATQSRPFWSLTGGGSGSGVVGSGAGSGGGRDRTIVRSWRLLRCGRPSAGAPARRPRFRVRRCGQRGRCLVPGT